LAAAAPTPKTLIRRTTFPPPQSGQGGDAAFMVRANVSNFRPQDSHWYS
jgi:hypothetical protein